MSTQSIISQNNLPTGDIIGTLLTEVSRDLLKEIRFEIGRVCFDKMKNVLRLSRLHCNSFCYIDEGQGVKIRENLIKQAVTKIKEL